MILKLVIVLFVLVLIVGAALCGDDGDDNFPMS